MESIIKIQHPQKIEKLSFEIIEKEVENHSFTKEEWRIVRRVIHTTADFDFLKLIKFHPDAISSAKKAIKRGCKIFTDTEMARAGINKIKLKKFGCEVLCYINHPEVVNLSKKNNITRASASVEYLLNQLQENIYVVGNAPTALIKLFEVITGLNIKPALVVGVPVGFVNAKESKDLFIKYNPVPFIVTKGRKGGSAIGAAIINEILKIVSEEENLYEK